MQHGGFALCRLDMVAQDWRAVKSGLQHAKELCNEGGDWERKNRLKVYEGTFFLATRDFKHAAKLFLDSIATFTAYASPTYAPVAAHILIAGFLLLLLVF
jgi:26S proteasome regulatory subunit N7